MEHSKKQVSASVDKLQDNEYFGVISSRTEHVQLKGDFQKRDILKCQYRTDYNIVFYTQISFKDNDDFANSEATKDKIKKNVVLFVTITVVSFLLIIIFTVVAFIVIRKKRKKRLESMSEYS
uniref:Transmembrane protein n=1 Tax=Strongyloides venezuelensis TaxID=75913 RepID=A0A0K0FSM0_STRVS